MRGAIPTKRNTEYGFGEGCLLAGASNETSAVDDERGPMQRRPARSDANAENSKQKKVYFYFY